MSKIRNRFERFCYRHRNKGIPNLMLYLTIGTALVYLLTYFTHNNVLYSYLSFNRNLILQGQVWRLFTYPLTYGIGEYSLIMVAISLFCYYSLGRAMETMWGTLRFNLYYLTGMVMIDVFCLLFGGYAHVEYLNLSLFLGYATLFPNMRFLLFFIIPIKAWIFAIIYLGLTIGAVVSLASAGFFPYCLFPLVSLLNYFLFFGKDVLNVLPLSWRNKFRKKKKKTTYKTVTFQAANPSPVTKPKIPHTHQCTICNRTDISNPELEFRYCSRCNGYYCYCEDHISDHTHVQ